MESDLLSKFFEKAVTKQLLQSLNENIRLGLMTHAKALAELNTGWETIFPCKVFLKNIQRRFDIAVDPEVIEKMGPFDEFEIWTVDARFLASSNQFYKLTNWTINDLLTKSREQLFARETKYQEQIDIALGKVMSGVPYVENPCEPHFVEELMPGGQKIFVTSKLFAPVFHSKTGEVAGVIAILNFKRISN